MLIILYLKKALSVPEDVLRIGPFFFKEIFLHLCDDKVYILRVDLTGRMLDMYMYGFNMYFACGNIMVN